MVNKRTIAKKGNQKYELLSGEKISTKWLSEDDEKWLKKFKEDVDKDEDYFVLLRAVRGFAAYPLKGAFKLTHKVAQSAVFRIADDIVKRVGIRQGFVLPSDPELESVDKNALMSAPEAAKMIGVTRAALHRALIDGRLRGWKIGTAWVTSRANALEYHENRRWKNRKKK